MAFVVVEFVAFVAVGFVAFVVAEFVAVAAVKEYQDDFPGMGRISANQLAIGGEPASFEG